MNATLMSELELAEVEGGPVPLLLIAAAALATVGGCSAS